jgi:hypothetical protein
MKLCAIIVTVLTIGFGGTGHEPQAKCKWSCLRSSIDEFLENSASAAHWGQNGAPEMGVHGVLSKKSEFRPPHPQVDKRNQSQEANEIRLFKVQASERTGNQGI